VMMVVMAVMRPQQFHNAFEIKLRSRLCQARSLAGQFEARSGA